MSLASHAYGWLVSQYRNLLGKERQRAWRAGHPAMLTKRAGVVEVLESRVLLAANAGGPYATNEGQGLTLNGSGDAGTVNYLWDINGDGVFGDTTGQNPTVTWAQLQALGINDGPFTVSNLRLRTVDGSNNTTDSPATTLNVLNVAPTLSGSGAGSVNEGASYTLNLSKSDPGNDTLTWAINWGDGSAVQNVPGTQTSVTHVYADGPATRYIAVTASDEDGSYSVPGFGSGGPAGSLDTSFGAGGKVITAFAGGDDHGFGLALQPDGKVIVSGYSGGDFALARYNPDGNLDTTFGAGGKVTTAIGGGEESAIALALQPDGKIILAGHSFNGSNWDWALARYNPDGTLDTAFGSGGKVTVPIGSADDYLAAVSVQSDGRIVAAGLAHNGTNFDFALARFNADGSLDTSFDGDGKATTAVGSSDDSVQAVALQANGKIVVAGDVGVPGGNDFAVARYNADGSLDTGFGSGGKVITAIGAAGDNARDLAIQPDGKIVVVGESHNGSNWDFALARFNVDGTLDSGFGGGGKVTASIGGGEDTAFAVVVQPDGKIVVAGRSHNGANNDFALARFNPNGSLDITFDGDGKMTTAIGGGDDYAYSMALQPDGRLVVAGDAHNGANWDLALARYHALEGFVLTVNNVAPTVDLGPDRNVVAGQSVTLTSSVTDPGTLDTTFSYQWKRNGVDVAGATSASYTFTPTGADNGATFSLVVTDKDGGIGSDAMVLYTMSAGGPYTIAEGQNLTLSGIGIAGYTYSWDINGDNNFTDATGLNPTLSWAQLGILGINDGLSTWNAKLRATDGASNNTDSPSVTLTVTDTAPTLSANGSGSVNEGVVYTLNLSASDGGNDTISQWTIDWGDGTAVQTVPGTPPSVTHVYADGVATRQIILSATNEDGTFVAASAAGSLDASFGSGGKVTTAVGSSNDSAQSLALQPDGKIVVAGYSHNGSNWDFALARYNADGSLDSSFDGDGKVTTDFGSSNDLVYSLVLQPDGRIVVAGSSFIGSNPVFALIRYHADGSLDSSFDGDGKVTTDFGGSSGIATSLVLQPDGKIVVAGYSHNGSNWDFALTRYNVNGSLDSSFDGDGKVTTALGSSNDLARSLALQPDGKIVVAGYSNNGSNDDFAVTRYNVNGSLDSSFDGDGKVTTALGSSNDYAWSLALQPDGKIIVVGSSNNPNGDFALTRYNADGSLDSSFDGDGKVTTAVGSSEDSAYSLVLQVDGRIVVAGYSNNGPNGDFALTRYNADGSLDSSFEGDGKVTTAVGSADDSAYSLVLQPDGKIVVAGYSSNGSNNDFALARYTGISNFAVMINNVAPTIALSGNSTVNEGSPYTLTLGAMTDPGVDTVTQWIVHWGDGNTDTYTSGGAKTHTYADGANNYTITVDLVDEDGTHLVAGSKSIGVLDVAPTLTLSGASSVNEGATYTLNLSATDPGADTISQWNINWGDGSAVQIVSGNPSSVTHVYADGANSHTISATATNEDGTFAAGNTVAVSVTNVIPTISLSGDATTNEGSAYTLTLGAITDPGADTATQWIVHWGDGNTDTYTSGGAKTHTFADGPFTANITVDLVDEDGTHVAAGSKSVNVLNVMPTLSASGASSVNEGSTYTLNLSKSDPGADTLTWAINWGDGSAAQNVPGTQTSVTHVYADGPATRYVVVTASDEDGSYSVPGLSGQPAGSLDTSFGTAGITRTLIGSPVDSGQQVMALQPDGKVLVAGHFYNGSSWQPVLARYNADGTLDASFGTGGKVTPSIFAAFTGGVTYQAPTVQQPNGRIVVSGQKFNGSNWDVLLVAYDAVTGALDTTFGGVNQGLVTIAIGGSEDYCQGMTVDAAGNLVLGCYYYTGTEFDLAVVRYTRDGLPDNAFGSGGIVLTPYADYDTAASVAVQPDGGIVVAGTWNDALPDLQLVRYRGSDGQLDATFGSGGRVLTDLGNSKDQTQQVVIQGDGKIVVAGYTYPVGDSDNGPSVDMAIVRYNADGTPDASFGVGGKVILPVGSHADRAFSLALQADGKIVVVGEANNGTNVDWVVVRLNPNGSLDSSFDVDGKLILPMGTAGDTAYDVVLQPDGRILVQGQAWNGSNLEWVLAQFNGFALTVNNVAPTVDLGPDRNVVAGQSVTLTSTVTDPGAPTDTFTYQWKRNGVDIAGATSASHTFTPTGADNGATFSLVVTDKDGGIGSDAMTLGIFGAGGPYTIAEGQGLTLAGAGLDGSASYGWDLNGDNVFTDAIGLNPTLTWAQLVVLGINDGLSTWNVKLRATDGSNNNTDSSPVVLTVTDVAPTLTLSGAASVNEGATYTLNLSATDPGADTISQWNINWGDGSAVQTVAGNPSSVTHVFADGANSHTISATATNEDGAFAAGNTVAVSVINVAPTIALSGNSTVNEGSTYTLTLGAITDPGTDTVTQWIVHWGDGNTDTYISNGAKTHTYADGANNYTITVDLVDEDGTHLVAGSKAISVLDVAPTLTLSGAGSVNEGATYTLNLSAGDPGVDTISQWAINWGDGSAIQTVAGNPSSVTHVFADGANSHTISATATNEDGTFTAGNTVAASVTNVIPTINLSGNATTNEGSLYTLTLGAITDPGTDTATQWIVHWGDGNTDTYTSGGDKTHTYADGPFTANITVDLVDEDGTHLAAGAKSVNVLDVAPTLTVTGASSVNEGAVYTLNLSVADPGQDTLTWSIDWGDGSAVQTVPQSQSAVTHVYVDGPATRSIAVSGTNEDGTSTAPGFTGAPPAGSLDGTFGSGGIVRSDIPAGSGGYNGAYSMAVQPDGKIVVVGYASNGINEDFVVARYNTDGTLDNSFDGDGIVMTDFFSPDVATCVALQSDGKIVVAGLRSGSYPNRDFVVARYDVNGSLDGSFGSGGRVFTDIAGNVEENVNSLVIQADGKIVVGGSWSQIVGVNVVPESVVVRYNSNGTPDTSFDGDGKLTDVFGGSGDAVFGLALHSDGRLIVAGTISYNNFEVARLNSNGSLDTSFGIGGRQTTDFAGQSDQPWSVLVQADGRIVVGGNAYNGGNTDFALARYNIDGSLDTSFGSGGKVLTPIGSGHGSISSLALQADGRIVAGGNAYNGGNTDFALARYNIDGSLDTSFGSGGKVTTDIGSSGDHAHSLALQPAGQIVVVGLTANGSSGHDFALARYIGVGGFTVTVNNVAPTITLSGNSTDNEGSAYTLTLGAITDPGIDSVTQWIVHWGDGNTDTYTSGGDKNHTYADGANNYTITVDLVDEDGTHAAAGSKAISVLDVAPTLTLSGAASVNEGATYTLNLAVTDPGADTITQWNINWGDGSAVQTVAGNPSSVTHVFADGANSYTISATATNEDGTFAAGNTVAVTVSNVVPTISLSGNATTTEGSAYTLTLGAITDPGADTATQWIVHWGDGNSDTYTSGGAKTHTYADGPFTVNITVDLVDEDGTHLAAGTKSVEVINVAPTIALSGDNSVAEGSPYTLTLGAITDPGPDTVTQWIVHWGDGNTDTFTSGGAKTHIYADGPTTPTITVDLVDEDGTHAGAGSKTISVTNVAPTIALSGNSSVNEGSVYTLTLGAITDPGADTVTQWIVNWGDGNTNTYTSGGAKTHVFADGPFTANITVDLMDEDGTYLTAGSKSVSVVNVVPTIALSGDSSIAEGSPYTLTLGPITDPGSDTATQWIVHWGDGNSDTYTSGGAKTHTYADGPFTANITVDLVDEDGTFIGAGSKTLNVTNVAPTITLSGNATTNEGSAYTLTLGAITDPGTDTATQWIVHWGDGNSDTYTSGGAKTHTYADGPFTVNITVDVVDEDGTHLAAGSKSVSVLNVAPTIALSGDNSVAEGSPYTLTLGAITDPGPDTVTQWIVHWGDGNTNTYTSGGAKTHTYADGPTTPTITVDLVDEDGTHAGAGSKTISVTNVVPIITPSGATSVKEGSTYVLAVRKTDPGADTLSYTVNWGDGQTNTVGATGNPTSNIEYHNGHWYIVVRESLTWTQAQAYAQQLGGHLATINDAAENLYVADLLTRVIGGDPWAWIGFNDQAIEGTFVWSSGEPVTYTNWAPAQPDDFQPLGGEDFAIINYNAAHQWNDRPATDTRISVIELVADAIITHTYLDGPNNYTISITGQDEDGGPYPATASLPVAVTNVVPTITLTGGNSVPEGSPYSLTLGTIADPGADTATQWIVHWGDGNSDTYTSSGAKTHTYADGPFTANITVDLVDEDGTFISAGSKTVSITNVAPTISLSGNATTNEGSAYTLTLGAITDPGVDTATQWIVHWGDGNTDTFTSGGAKTHIYADGPFTANITVDLVDEDGTHLAAGTKSVDVLNVTPTLSASGSSSVNEGSTYTLNLSKSDPGADTLTWSINWGDGSAVQNVPGTQTSVTHVYADGPATRHISVTASDEDGSYSVPGLSGQPAASLDTSFGTGGVTRTPFGSQVDSVNQIMALQPDGKILVAGTLYNPSGQAVLARYLADGTLDATFGTGGKTTPVLNAGFVGGVTYLAPTAQQPNGRIVVSGNKFNGSNWDVLLTAYDAVTGALDTTFGGAGQGVVTIAIGGSDDYCQGMTVDTSGNLVLGCYYYTGSEFDLAVVRYTRDGLADNTFGSGGIVLTPFAGYDTAASVAVQPDGGIIVAGQWNGASPDFRVVRYLGSNGQLDGTFGSGGRATTDFGNSNDVAQQMVIQADGKIVVAGYTYPVGDSDNGPSVNMAIARYNADGSPDLSFGTGGKVILPVGSHADRAFSLALQGDGKIVVVGEANNGANVDWAVIRLNANGSLDGSFDIDGKLIMPMGTAGDTAYDVVLQPDGRILVQGQYWNGSTVDWVLARFQGAEGLPVTVNNVTPTIALAGNSSTNEGAVYTLTLGAITDPGTDTATQWIVHWGDGNTDTYSSSGAKTHSYADGPFTANITVDLVDEDGTYLTAGSKSVSVVNVAPAIALSGGTSVTEGSPYILTLGAITDPGADTMTQWIVHWGDGNSDTYTSGGVRTHTYVDGSFTANITVDLVDEEGTYLAAASKSVNVTNVAPTISLSGNATTNEGAAYTLTLGTITDPGADTATQWIVHWGDGNNDTYTSGGARTHTYADGPFTANITVDLVDEDGTHLAAASKSVSVLNVGPTLSASAASSVNEGATYTLSLTSSDPGADTISQWTINWGDGSPIQPVAGNPSSVTHVYADGASQHTIAASASDEDGTFQASVAIGVAGGLDFAFGSEGAVVTAIGSGADVAYAVARQSDGKLLVAGYSDNGTNNDFALIRYNAGGTLDVGFGTNGKVTTSMGGIDEVRAIAIQTDGRIVAGGHRHNGGYDFALARYNADGTLDTSFDGDGKVTTAIGTSNDFLYSLAIQPDGKIVAAGYYLNGPNDDFALVRYNSNGSLDTTFDGDGKVQTPMGPGTDRIWSMALAPDGRIVAAGWASNGVNNDFAVAVYQADGSLDSSFDGDGKVTTAIGTGDDFITGVALQGDGKIVVAGYRGGANDDIALARYNLDGSLDIGFDLDGKRTVSVGSSHDRGNALTIAPDGRIVVGGYANNGSNNDMSVVRLNADGSLDGSFGTGGKVTTPIGSGADQGQALLIQPDGGIVLAGVTGSGANADFVVVRYQGSPASVVTVNNVSPTVNLGADRVERTGQSITLASTVIDPGSVDTFTYQWKKEGVSIAGATGPTHAFITAASTAGTYTLEVTDKDGGIATDDLAITIDDTPPTASSGQLNLNAPLNGTLSVSLSESIALPLLLSQFRVDVVGAGGGPYFPSSVTQDSLTHIATFSFAASLPDNNYRGTLTASGLTDAAGNTMAADFQFDFFVLVGDANRDRAVNFFDLTALAANYGNTSALWAHGDFNGDAAVNFFDLTALASNYGATLPVPSAPIPAEVVLASAIPTESSAQTAAVTATIDASPSSEGTPPTTPSASVKPVEKSAASAKPRSVFRKPTLAADKSRKRLSTARAQSEAPAESIVTQLPPSPSTLAKKRDRNASSKPIFAVSTPIGPAPALKSVRRHSAR